MLQINRSSSCISNTSQLYCLLIIVRARFSENEVRLTELQYRIRDLRDLLSGIHAQKTAGGDLTVFSIHAWHRGCVLGIF